MDNSTIIQELLAEVGGMQQQLEVMMQQLQAMKQRLTLAEVSMQADAAALQASKLRVKQLEIIVANQKLPAVSPEPVPVEETIKPALNDVQPTEQEQPAETIRQEVKVELKEAAPTESPVRSEIKDARLISDLRKAIGLNDRFRLKNDLFSNNEALLWETIDALNALDSMSEARGYLQARFSWSDDNATAVYFYEILERKFVRP